LFSIQIKWPLDASGETNFDVNLVIHEINVLGVNARENFDRCVNNDIVADRDSLERRMRILLFFSSIVSPLAM